MKVSVIPAYPYAAEQGVYGGAVVIDTLRMTSVAVTALENGCESIRVVAEPEEAKQLARETGALLGGERNAVKIPGFDLDNSPLAYTREAVAGKRLVMTTSNGTRAILAAKGAEKLALGCLRNAAAAAKAVAGFDAVTLLCAGTRGCFSLEDGLTAGAVLAALPGAEPDDLGAAMLALYRAYEGREAELLSGCAHVRRLSGLGFAGDVRWCLETNCTCTVPVWKDGIFLPECYGEEKNA